jgi:hypothetical protein
MPGRGASPIGVNVNANARASFQGGGKPRPYPIRRCDSLFVVVEGSVFGLCSGVDAVLFFLAEPEALDFSGTGTREGIAEFDGTRILIRGDVLFDEVL